jgi:tetraacyldisaccharide 4'-kinase
VSVADSVWNDSAWWSGVARLALSPASVAYRGVTSLRNALYDRGTFPAHGAEIPVLSVGNPRGWRHRGRRRFPPGWQARVRERGARPAIVMRGYGDDEHRVHALVNPDVPVIVSADRVAGVRNAIALGCDVAIMDDAFQHRRLGAAGGCRAGERGPLA